MDTKEAAQVRRTLAEHGMSASEFARRVGISHVYLGDILNGRRQGRPVREKILRLSAGLGESDGDGDES